jgi:DNA invertase Pin-like site-specific DNA recombinase
MSQAKAFSYIRFSSPAQSGGDSVRRQSKAARAYCSSHNLLLDEELTFQDFGVSAFRGRNVDEGALGAFLNAIKAGKIPKGSFLLVESLDRLSRQAPWVAAKTMDSIVREGLTVVDLMDGGRAYNSKTLTDDTMEFLMMVVRFMRAHEESSRKSQRVSDAWAQKRASAHILPMTKTCPAWLELSKDRKKYIPIPDRVKTIQWIYGLHPVWMTRS